MSEKKEKTSEKKVSSQKMQLLLIRHSEIKVKNMTVMSKLCEKKSNSELVGKKLKIII